MLRGQLQPSFFALIADCFLSYTYRSLAISAIHLSPTGLKIARQDANCGWQLLLTCSWLISTTRLGPRG